MKPKGFVRRTRQREVILEVLRGTKSHPTADWVYQEVRKEMPQVSLGTIYRNLKTLSEHGEIQELASAAPTPVLMPTRICTITSCVNSAG